MNPFEKITLTKASALARIKALGDANIQSWEAKKFGVVDEEAQELLGLKKKFNISEDDMVAALGQENWKKLNETWLGLNLG
jgi:hypothetical protein